MKFGYIPIDPIISELQAQLKTMVKMGKFDTDDCYQYIIQCLRKIGVHEYDVHEEIIEIKKHRAAIPKHFYVFEEVRLAEKGLQCDDSFVFNNDYYRIGKSLKPVDNNTVSLCNEKFYNTECCEIGFSFKIPPGVINCDLRDGLIYAKYHGLKRDCNGNYLMQDEENGIEAVKNFVKLQVLEEDYLMQKLPRYIYVDIQAKFDNAFGLAQNTLLALSAPEVDAMVRKDRKKFDKFKLK